MQAGPRLVSPFDGDPTTRVITDERGAVQVVIVEARVMTPLRAKWADFLDVVSALVMWTAIGAFLYSCEQMPPVPVLVTALIMPIVMVFVMHCLIRRWLLKKTVMAFTEDRFSVMRGRGKLASYDRHEIGPFRLKIHDKAKEEAEQHELAELKARMQGQIKRKKKYYGDSFVLRVIHGGYPRDLMEILGEKDAERILARLQAVNQFMDQVMALGQAPVSGPQADWDDLAGRIPEKV